MQPRGKKSQHISAKGLRNCVCEFPVVIATTQTTERHWHMWRLAGKKIAELQRTQSRPVCSTISVRGAGTRIKCDSETARDSDTGDSETRRRIQKLHVGFRNYTSDSDTTHVVLRNYFAGFRNYFVGFRHYCVGFGNFCVGYRNYCVGF